MAQITTHEELITKIQNLINTCSPQLALSTQIAIQNRNDSQIADGYIIRSSIPVKIRVFGMKEAKGIEGVYKSMEELRDKINKYCTRYNRFYPELFHIELSRNSVSYGRGRLDNFGSVEYVY